MSEFLESIDISPQVKKTPDGLTRFIYQLICIIRHKASKLLTKKHKNKEVALTKEEKEKKAEETLEKSKRIQATKSVLILENLKKSRKDIDINAFKEKLEIAFKIALDVHGKSTRHSSEPYIIHLIAVCDNLINYVKNPSQEAILAAILHDAIEDAGEEEKDIIEQIKKQEEIKIQIEEELGPKVFKLCMGLTKVSKQSKKETNEKRKNEDINDLIEMLQGFAEEGDIEVILIKLCDRLHNMQTLASHKKPDRIAKILKETIKVYYPIAYRLGMYGLRTGLSEAFLDVLANPEYGEKTGNSRKSRKLKKTLSKIHYLLDNNENKKDNAVRELEATLKKQRIGGVKVTAINKSVYSIYRHLEEDKKDNKERSFALRVILETPELSEKEKVSKLEKIGYQIANLLRISGDEDYTNLVKSDKELVTNYYNTDERDDGYKAIHTQIKLSDGSLVEVQIMGKEEAENAMYGNPRKQSEKLQADLFKKVFGDEGGDKGLEIKYNILEALVGLRQNLPTSIGKIVYSNRVARTTDNIIDTFRKIFC